MKCQKCGRAGTPSNPMFQLACARPICAQKHLDDDGEIRDCAADGPVETHFNVQVCKRCGGSAFVKAAMRLHQKVCEYRKAA